MDFVLSRLAAVGILTPVFVRQLSSFVASAGLSSPICIVHSFVSADSDLVVYSFVWCTVYAIDLDSWLTCRQMGRMIHDNVYFWLVFILLRWIFVTGWFVVNFLQLCCRIFDYLYLDSLFISIVFGLCL